MSMTDPIADMLTRIRNAQRANHPSVEMQCSKKKMEIARVLCEQNFCESFEKIELDNNKASLKINLRYFDGAPVISEIKRISKPSLRVYSKAKNMTKILGGFALAIVSTSKGVMTDVEARRAKIGGEVLCYVW